MSACWKSKGPREGSPAVVLDDRRLMDVTRLWDDDATAAPENGETHMPRKQIQGVLMGLGLAALLTLRVGTWGVASAASEGPIQSYTGQVREINIGQCGLEPGTCEGSLVIAQ